MHAELPREERKEQRTQRIQGVRHSITVSNDSNSAHREGIKRWLDAAVCHFVAAVRELILYRRARRHRTTLCSQVEFNCGPTETHCHKFLRLRARQPLISPRWADAIFNYAHWGKELEV